MSYILEALEKNGKNKPASIDETDELVSSSETKKYTADRAEQIVSQPTTSSHGVVHTSNISISWGILLFIAIMSALVLGFWLGQQNGSNKGNNSPEVAVINASDNVSTLPLNIPNTQKVPNSAQSFDSGKTEALKEQASIAAAISGQTPQNTASQVKPNPAEQFFENPPQDSVNNKPVIAPEKIEITTESQVGKPVETETENIAEFSAEDLKAVDGISDDLLAKFKTALTETAIQPEDSIEGDSSEDKFTYNQNSADPYRSVKPLSDMPERMQDQLPTLQFEQHIFASDGEGWVKVNGRDRYEGDTIATGVSLIKIQPQEVILEFRDRVFSMPALTSW